MNNVKTSTQLSTSELSMFELSISELSMSEPLIACAGRAL
jgi:hypothetical protein